MPFGSDISRYVETLLIYTDINKEVVAEEALPVRMVWKAVSTLVESRADVSRKDRPFFSGEQKRSSTSDTSAFHRCADTTDQLKDQKEIQEKSQQLLLRHEESQDEAQVTHHKSLPKNIHM